MLQIALIQGIFIYSEMPVTCFRIGVLQRSLLSKEYGPGNGEVRGDVVLRRLSLRQVFQRFSYYNLGRYPWFRHLLRREL